MTYRLLTDNQYLSESTYETREAAQSALDAQRKLDEDNPITLSIEIVDADYEPEDTDKTTLRQYIEEGELSPEGFDDIENELDSPVQVLPCGYDVNGGGNEVVRIYPDGLDSAPLRLGVFNPGNGTSTVKDFSDYDESLSEFDIEIEEEFEGSEVAGEAQLVGAKYARLLGRGDCGGMDGKVFFYEMLHSDGTVTRFAKTNGDPVWEENDYDAFRELAYESGVSLK